MSQFATRLATVEGRSSGVAAESSLTMRGIAQTAPPQPPPGYPILGMPGYGGIPPLQPSPSVITHTDAPHRPIPITQIPFPHSPSQIPTFQQPPQDHLDDHDDGAAVPRYHKLSFPVFDGKEDPIGWLNRCDHFFRAQRTREADKVWLASFHMTGVAQHWFYMLERDAGDIHAITWPMFKSLCQQRFGPPLGTNHLAELVRLPFRGLVSDYQDIFQMRLAHAGPLSAAQQVQLFTGGLPQPLRTDVELHAPQDLQRAMALARVFERRLSSLPSSTFSRAPRLPPRTSQMPPTTSAPTASPQATAPVPPQGTSRPLRRLSPAEMAERRQQGLCYNCDEQYIRGHKCPKLFYLEVTGFDDLDDTEHTSTEEHEDQLPLISLHAIAGLTTNDTMKVNVKIGESVLCALLDSGSSSNFISLEAADHIGLHLHDSNGASVIVANGDRVACRGLARDVAARIGSEFFSVECYTIPLDCFDMVLGISFLKTLGPILWNFDELCMSFWHRGHRVVWRGIGSPQRAKSTPGHIHALYTTEPPLLESLLTSFQDVFDPPQDCPQHVIVTTASTCYHSQHQ